MIKAATEFSVSEPHSERERLRQVAAQRRAAERDLKIPAIVSPQRRADCEHDDKLWLKTYLPDVFRNPFTLDQEKIIAECGEALTYGTSKCIAAPRGDGKSSIATYLTQKYALYRQIKFGLLICATSPKSDEAIKKIKHKLTRPPGHPLFDDFPLECTVGRYVAGSPQRQNNVTAGGEKLHVEWHAGRLILPSFPDRGDSMGSIIVALGYESEQLQGCNVYDVRPDWVMVDDLDSRDSLAAVDGSIAGKIEDIIDKNIGGLGAPGEKLGQIYLCTITSRRSAAFKYSDPTQKPAWSGMRIPRIRRWPERTDLWEKYIVVRQHGKATRKDSDDATSPPLDPHGREAHKMLVENFDEMHREAELSNEYDFNSQILPDGSATHVSALQKCYDYIADKGMDSFLTEHQNDPLPEDDLERSGITSAIVASRISGLEYQELPHQFKSLVAFIDLGHSWCYWGDSAWQQECIGAITDYGALDVHGITKESDQAALERALLKTLHEWRGMLLGKYKTHEGQTRNPDLCLVDSGSGLHSKAVYEFCRQVGHPFYPSKGFDRNVWRPPAKSVKAGDHWALVPQSGGVKLYEFDATYWKQFAHQRFMTPTFDSGHRLQPGSLSLFICPELEQHRKQRREFTHQAVAEIWGVKKLGAKPGWIGHSKNHYQDVTAGLCLAASVTGIDLIGTKQSKPRVPLNQMARKSA